MKSLCNSSIRMMKLAAACELRRAQKTEYLCGLMKVLAELEKPAIGDTWMGQTVDDHMSTSKSPRSVMGWRGE